MGETYLMSGTKKRGHMNRVKLTKAYVENGNMEIAEKRMNDRDGGLERLSNKCTFGTN